MGRYRKRSNDWKLTAGKGRLSQTPEMETDMDFVKIADFNNKLEAETVAHVLDGHDIPWLVKSDEGFFGDGGISDQVSLKVPADKVEQAKEVLEGVTDELD